MHIAFCMIPGKSGWRADGEMRGGGRQEKTEELCQGGQQRFLWGAGHQNQKRGMENTRTTPTAHYTPYSQS